MSNQLSDTIEQILSGSSFNYGLLIESDGQALVEHNSHETFPSASLIKLAILNDVLDSHLDLDQKVDVDSEHLVGGAGVLQLMQPRKWTLRDLLALMISVSDNSATNLVISVVGMSNVQDYLVNQEFKQTELNRYLMDATRLPMGLTIIRALQKA